MCCVDVWRGYVVWVRMRDMDVWQGAWRGDDADGRDIVFTVLLGLMRYSKSKRD